MNYTEEMAVLPSDGKMSPLRSKSELMDTEHEIDGHGVPAGEEAWEEYGCVIWDLAASRTHAELMVPILRTFSSSDWTNQYASLM